MGRAIFLPILIVLQACVMKDVMSTPSNTKGNTILTIQL